MGKKTYRNVLFFFFLVVVCTLLLEFSEELSLPLDASHLLPSQEVPMENGSIEVFFCPMEDCEAVIIDLLMRSSERYCAFYDIDLENLTDTLVSLNVPTLIFEEEDVDAPPSFIRVGSRGLMHNKFCILDNQYVVTGSMNPTFNGAYKNDNNLIVIESRYLANNYYEEWLELQGGVEKKTAPSSVLLELPGRDELVLVENYFCPEDNCESEVLDELSIAQDSIHFMTFSFTSDPIGDLLVSKHLSGVEVRGVQERRQKNSYWEFDKLVGAGVDVVLDGNSQTMHHKVFVIDEKTVITGSYNPTKSGTERNDENILIIHDAEIAARFLDEFERVYVDGVLLE